MFFVALATSLLLGVFGQQTESGANVIFARPSRSNTSDEISGQNYPNAHLVFVTESNRGVLSSTPVPELRTIDGDSVQDEEPMETTRFQCGTSNPCAFQPYTLKGLDRTMGPVHQSVCYCPLGEVCRYHRDNLQNRMLEFRCKPTETTTANSTGAV